MPEVESLKPGIEFVKGAGARTERATIAFQACQPLSRPALEITMEEKGALFFEFKDVDLTESLLIRILEAYISMKLQLRKEEVWKSQYQRNKRGFGGQALFARPEGMVDCDHMCAVCGCGWPPARFAGQARAPSPSPYQRPCASYKADGTLWNLLILNGKPTQTRAHPSGVWGRHNLGQNPSPQDEVTMADVVPMECESRFARNSCAQRPTMRPWLFAAIGEHMVRTQYRMLSRSATSPWRRRRRGNNRRPRPSTKCWRTRRPCSSRSRRACGASRRRRLAPVSGVEGGLPPEKAHADRQALDEVMVLLAGGTFWPTPPPRWSSRRGRPRRCPRQGSIGLLSLVVDFVCLYRPTPGSGEEVRGHGLSFAGLISG